MSVKNVVDCLKALGLGERVMTFEDSSATVELAAMAVGCEPARIAKTLSFYVKGQPIVVVAAGDAKIDNRKYREAFLDKAKMIPYQEVEEAVGHAPGGVCPFMLKQGVAVYLDASLKRFDAVYPAAGDDHSAVRLAPEELFTYANAAQWVDVCKDWTA